jgi:hypothetical protein
MNPVPQFLTLKQKLFLKEVISYLPPGTSKNQFYDLVFSQLTDNTTYDDPVVSAAARYALDHLTYPAQPQ